MVKGQFVVLALSFYHVHPGNGTQVIRLGCEYLLPLNYLIGLEGTSHSANFSLTVF